MKNFRLRLFEEIKAALTEKFESEYLKYLILRALMEASGFGDCDTLNQINNFPNNLTRKENLGLIL